MSALREVFARFSTSFDGRPLQRGSAQTSMLTDKLRTLGTVVLGTLGVGAARRFVEESAAIGDELDKTSKVIGISIQDLQSWRHAANLSGVGAEAFNSGVTRLQKMMLDASNGLTTAQEAFATLGVNVADADGSLRPVGDVLSDMADPLANLSSSSERVGLLMQLMGRSGARMGPLFAEGRAGVEAMRAELEALGGGASQEFIDSSAQLTDELARLDISLLSLRSRIGVFLLPIVEKITNTIAAFARNTRLLKTTLAVVTSLIAAKLIPALVAMGRAGLIANLKAFGLFLVIGAAILGVIILIEDMITAVQGGDSVFGDMIRSTEEWINDMRDAEGVIGMIASVLDKVALAAEQVGIEIARVLGAGPDEATVQRVLEQTGGAINLRTAEGMRAARRVQAGDSASDVIAGLQRDRSTGAIVRGIASGGRQTEAERSAETQVTIARINRGAQRAAIGEVNQNIQVNANVDARGLDETAARRLVGREITRSLSEALEANAPGAEEES